MTLGRTNDQPPAVSHVLRSADHVVILRGRAGAGKTTLMREAMDAIQRPLRKQRKTVHAYALSASDFVRSDLSLF